VMIWDEKGPSHSTKNTQNMMLSKAPKTPEESMKRFAEIFDLSLSPDAQKTVTGFFTKEGAECYRNTDHWAGVLYNCLKMMSGCPDNHIC
jgi:hypothetical protein